MEEFPLGYWPLGGFIFGLVCGPFTKSHRKSVKGRADFILWAVIFSLAVIGYIRDAFGIFSFFYMSIFIGSYCGGVLVGLARLPFAKNARFASLFPTQGQFIIGRSDMDVHEINCGAQRLRLLCPAKTAPQEFYSSLQAPADVAQPQDAQGLHLLSYDLAVLGGQEPNPNSRLHVDYQLHYFAKDNLFDFDNMKRRVNDYVFQQIYARDDWYCSEKGYRTTLKDVRISAGSKPFIRYGRYIWENKYDEYLHAPISAELMLTIHLSKSLHLGEVVLDTDIEDFLFNEWSVLPLNSNDPVGYDLQGWDSQSCSEIQSPLPMRKDFISAREFEKTRCGER